MTSIDSHDSLVRHVAALNILLPDFKEFWSETDTFNIITDIPEYNTAFKEWMSPTSFKDKPNATHDFLEKISSDNLNKRINIDDDELIWIDMSLDGTVDGKLITKWTRITFRLIGHFKWELYFDTTLDNLKQFDDPKSSEFAAEMHEKSLLN